MFADADRYEMQTVSIASPMTSPHRYSPSVYSLQVIHLYYHHAHVFIIMILVYQLPEALFIALCHAVCIQEQALKFCHHVFVAFHLILML